MRCRRQTRKWHGTARRLRPTHWCTEQRMHAGEGECSATCVGCCGAAISPLSRLLDNACSLPLSTAPRLPLATPSSLRGQSGRLEGEEGGKCGGGGGRGEGWGQGGRAPPRAHPPLHRRAAARTCTTSSSFKAPSCRLVAVRTPMAAWRDSAKPVIASSMLCARAASSAALFGAVALRSTKFTTMTAYRKTSHVGAGWAAEIVLRRGRRGEGGCSAREQRRRSC